MKRTKRLVALIMSALVVGGIAASGNLNTVTACAAVESKAIDNTFISENNYTSTMKNVVEPYIDSVKKTGYLDVGASNFKIYYEKYKVNNSKGSIVISHGFTESAEKFHEIIYYYMQEGYSVYILEHRGHGRSGHLGKDSSQISLNEFDDYVTDFKQFMDNVVKPETSGQKLFLFAHSMGGAIGTRFLEQNPGYFNAAILSAPMLEVNTGSVPGWAAQAIANVNTVLTFGDNYIAGQGPYSGTYDFSSAATNSEARYSYYYDIEKATTEIQRGGGSYRWLQKSLYASKDAIKKENAQKVTIPVMLFQAENDDFVKAGGQNTFAQYAPNCTLVKVSGAKHEIYKEKDSILKPYLNQVLNFYNGNL